MNTITLYYANWCGHCQQFKGTWESIKKYIDEYNTKNPDIKIKYEEYEADKDVDIIKRENITGFPTIMLLIGGKRIEYHGPRTIKDIMNRLTGGSEQSGGCNNGGCSSCAISTINSKDDDIYYQKYLKYKKKYFMLKKKI